MVESLSQISNNVQTGKRQKYTSQQLREIEASCSEFNVHQLYDVKSVDVEDACKRFVGHDKLVIQLTSAQQIYNNHQNHGKMLTFDLRSRMNFHQAHLKDSLSFPIDLCDEEFFIKWDTNLITSAIIKNKEKQNLFKNRKRLYINIVAGQEDIQTFVYNATMLFNDSHLKNQTNNPLFNSKQSLADILSLRNAMLLIKALKNERIRDVCLCVNGFNVFADKYPYLCKFRTSVLYPKPLVAKNYPSEILEGRLYLGDQFHAADKQIMKHLRVTHILNVSSMIPNHFENSRSLNIQYLRINIEDQHDVQIKMSFPLAYQFIESAFQEEQDFYKNPARANPLVDDVFQTQMELNKRQKLKLKSTALLDTLEAQISTEGQIPMTRQQNKANKVAYQIDQAVDAFNRKSSNRNVVFVHCAMGKSRSATCVIMYIMKRFGVKFEDALEFVLLRRKCVDPNEGFLRQLREFEDKGMDFGHLHQHQTAPGKDQVECLIMRRHSLE